MKKLAILSVAFVFAALLTISASAQTAETKKESALLGSWSITISAPGQDVPGTLKLEKDGDSLKGSVTTELSGESILKNVKINDDNTFTADISVNVQGQSFEGTVSGKLEGDKLTGELNLAGLGAIPFAGKKAE